MYHLLLLFKKEVAFAGFSSLGFNIEPSEYIAGIV
jgi:hypothetical protein